jgi:hypothetical protein
MSKYIPLPLTKVNDPNDSDHIRKDQLWDLPMRVGIIGKSLISSKTTTLEHLLARPYSDQDVEGQRFYRKNFKPENIYIVCPTMDGKMQMLIDALEIPSTNIMTEYNEEQLLRVCDNIERMHFDRKAKGEPLEHTVIVMDDCSFSGKLKEKVFGVVSKIVCNLRHVLLSLIITSQYYVHLPPVFRTNATGIMMFECVGAGLDTLIDEHNSFDDKKTFRALFRKATSEPRKAFIINYTKPERYFDGNFMPLSLDGLEQDIMEADIKSQCTATHKNGNPCRCKAKAGSTRCGRHQNS